jgi:hypothetical protein
MTLGAGVLVVATAAITAIGVSKWNLFPPKDYEECAERAAKDGKSKDALSVLLSICSSEFEGRRKPGGGYAYYDSCQDRTFDIKGPNPTADEQRHIRERCFTYLDAQARLAAEKEESERKAQQAAREANALEIGRQQANQLALQSAMQARKLAAIPAINVTPGGFDDCGFSMCTFMHVEVINGSKEAISKISIGLSAVSTNKDVCPSSYAKKEEVGIKLSPGERGKAIIDFVDIELSKHPVCIKVLDVQFADVVSNPTPAVPAWPDARTVCVPDPSKRTGVICRPM